MRKTKLLEDSNINIADYAIAMFKFLIIIPVSQNFGWGKGCTTSFMFLNVRFLGITNMDYRRPRWCKVLEAITVRQVLCRDH